MSPTTAWRRQRRRVPLDAPPTSGAERVALGKQARAEVPLASHGAWEPPADRPDPLALLAEQAATRVPELVPIRHGRMLVSPFTYYRGAALPMAADLSATPTSGLWVQLCGDAHLSNFGIFGSPERHLVFDVNDFDETAPGPWEWDVKRLAASLEVAARENEMRAKERARVVRATVRAYRVAMRSFAKAPMMSVWYAHLDMDELAPRFRAALDPSRTPSVWHAVANARAHDSHQAYEKLCRTVDGEPRFIEDPPLVVPLAQLFAGEARSAMEEALAEILRAYARTLQGDRRLLLGQHRIVDIARKVVGVGSVGTNAWIALFLDRGGQAPLMLQVKQAEPSVLERFTTRSRFTNHGQRVVEGQRLMQAASDIFLGWVRASWAGHPLLHYYVRQLRDWKGSADIAGMTPSGMELWGQMCGWTLARAHARSGDRIAIAAYLGKSEAFEQAVTAFAGAYADQNERDHQRMARVVEEGGLPALRGL